MMDDIGIPGMSLAVIENNEIVFTGSYGVKDLDSKTPIDDQTVFEAGSLSKAFLTFVVLQLVDEGKIELDKPVYEYLPNPRLEHDARYKLITSRMILTHSSGIENWQYRNNSNQLDIESDPGKKMVYSGEAYNYLSKVVGAILDQTYEEYIDERVIQPYGLQNTYLTFKEIGEGELKTESPSNYAIGYDDWIRKWQKAKNRNPNPAARNSVTAEDYSKLMLAIFAKKKLSDKIFGELMTPDVPVLENDAFRYRGLGFELILSKEDTVINHLGHNPGFRTGVYYSPKLGRGFVYFTNHDRGWLVGKQLNELTSKLNLNTHFDDYYEQYPSNAIALFKIFMKDGSNAALTEARRLALEEKLNEYTLMEIGEVFGRRDRDSVFARLILELNIRTFPDKPSSHAILGDLFVKRCDYASALGHFKKAKALNFDLWDLEKDIRQCEEDAEKRATICSSHLALDQSLVIEGEDFCRAYGVDSMNTNDDGGGQNVWIENGEWAEYQLNASRPGYYSVKLRVATPNNNNQIQLRAQDRVVSAFEVPKTNGWQNWETITTQVYLNSGNQELKLYSSTGDFNLNWIEIEYANMLN